jgi:hypothetical protein
VSTLVTSFTHSGALPEHQVAQVTPPGAYMSQLVPPDARHYSTVTVIPLLNSILTTRWVVTRA